MHSLRSFALYIPVLLRPPTSTLFPYTTLFRSLLAELEDAPPLLVARGDLGLLDRQSVAIVGARNASAAACRFARSEEQRLNSSHMSISYAVFCLKKKTVERLDNSRPLPVLIVM